jgi:MYXO-CTERM domain-containing protein
LPGDSDDDGICDSDDACVGDDLSSDSDGDGVCDDSDECPLDNPDDVDDDGICDSEDFCRGDNSTGDDDEDGVCNDLDHDPALIEASAFTGVGGSCGHGGVRIDVGIDFNDDGTLQGSEITNTTYVCNGAPGTSGVGSLISVTSEGSGDHCAISGVRIDQGMDDGAAGGPAGNGQLEAGEVRSTSYVCDGASGAAGSAGTDGDDGDDGDDGAAGPRGSAGPRGPAGAKGDDGDDGDDGAAGPRGAVGADGTGAVSRITVLGRGDRECPSGGFTLSIGRDDDGDGTLDNAEIDDMRVLCNGAAGHSTVVDTRAIEPGDEDCPDGGLHVRVGIDDGAGGGNAGNGKLESGEIDDEQDVCLSPTDVVLAGGGGAGGCSTAPVGTRGSGAGLALLLVGALLVRRRRSASRPTVG